MLAFSGNANTEKCSLIRSWPLSFFIWTLCPGLLFLVDRSLFSVFGASNVRRELFNLATFCLLSHSFTSLTVLFHTFRISTPTTYNVPFCDFHREIFFISKCVVYKRPAFPSAAVVVNIEPSWMTMKKKLQVSSFAPHNKFKRKSVETSSPFCSPPCRCADGNTFYFLTDILFKLFV